LLMMVTKYTFHNNRDALAEGADPASLDGPRSATRQIISNKGLTPKRNKLNRNPRLKKRVKFEQAKKKISSQKAVYKGGEAKEGYQGETTGISKSVVKSRRL
jgi:U3 small nucleolar RNA-associated protein 3